MSNARNNSVNLRNYVTFEDFGAVGDGVANDTTALRECLSFAISQGIGTVYGTGGRTYKVTLNLQTYAPTSPFTLDLRGGTIDASGMGDTESLLQFSGSLGAEVNLTANGTLGQSRVSVASTAGFARKQWVRIVSNAIWDASNTNTKLGELNRIPDHYNGTTGIAATSLELATALADTYETADSARVAPVTMADRVTVRNGRFIGPSGNQNTCICMRFNYTTNALVENCYFEQWDLAAIYIRHSANFNIERNRFYNARPSGLGYGVELVDTSCDGVVHGNHFDDIRHSLSTNNNTSIDSGIVRRVTFSGNTVRSSAYSQGVTSAFTVVAATDIVTLGTPSNSFLAGRAVTVSSTGALPGGLATDTVYWAGSTTGSPVATLKFYLTIDDAVSGTSPVDITSAGTGTHTAQVYGGGDAIDTHGGADFIRIINNTCIGASASGINVECPNVEVIGNEIIEAQAYGIAVRNECDRNGRAVVANNRVSRCTGAGISVRQGIRGTAFSYTSVAVTGNVVTDCGLRPTMFTANAGIDVRGGASAVRGAAVTGNVVQGGSSSGIATSNTRGLTLTGNVVYGNAGIGLEVDDCLFGTVAGNTVQADTSTAVPCINVTATGAGTTSRVSISGNSVGPQSGSGTAVGIVLDNNVTNTAVIGNTVGGMTGAVTLGSGSGNVSANNIG